MVVSHRNAEGECSQIDISPKYCRLPVVKGLCLADLSVMALQLSDDYERMSAQRQGNSRNVHICFVRHESKMLQVAPSFVVQFVRSNEGI